MDFKSTSERISGPLPGEKVLIFSKDLQGIESFSFRFENYYVIVLDSLLSKASSIENIQWYINEFNSNFLLSST